MPNARPVATFRRQRLGNTFKRLRTEAGLTNDHVARAMQWKPPKVSRIENGNARIRPEETDALLDLYKVENPAWRAAVHKLGDRANQNPWWRRYEDVLSEGHGDAMDLEEDATRIRAWYPSGVPGLIQCPTYAKEAIDCVGSNVKDTPSLVTSLVQVRMMRQSILTVPDHPAELHAVVNRVFLQANHGAPAPVMRDQVRFLIDMVQRANVTIQVMPEDAPQHMAYHASIVLFDYEEPHSPVVTPGALADSFASDRMSSSRHDEFVKAFDVVKDLAMSPEESLGYMQSLL